MLSSAGAGMLSSAGADKGLPQCMMRHQDCTANPEST
jgi:hypothetical protein